MHHAGLLPIVKEVVEMLFCRGVVKVILSNPTSGSFVYSGLMKGALFSCKCFPQRCEGGGLSLILLIILWYHHGDRAISSPPSLLICWAIFPRDPAHSPCLRVGPRCFFLPCHGGPWASSLPTRPSPPSCSIFPGDFARLQV